jgi:DNA invertase Pin-like site-specific DNA recombinase
VDLGVSGSKDRRPALDRLMKDARARMIDGVLVSPFDRFARSTKHLVTALEEFQALGVDFVSLGESVDTSTPMGKMIFTVLGAVAELERSLIKERVAMGLERARNEGKPHGRPRKIFDREKAQRLRDQGKSYREIGRIMGVNKGTITGQLTK